jgi:hypothetical protein
MDEKDPHSAARRDHDIPRRISIDAAHATSRLPTILWRMRSATFDNQASCSVTVDDTGCDVLVVFTKGFGVPEHFADISAAMHHSMEIAGRLTAQGWVDIEIRD